MPHRVFKLISIQHFGKHVVEFKDTMKTNQI